MLPTTLKFMKQADSKCRMPEGRRSWCRYLRRRVHLSHVMEGLRRQRGVFCLPSQKHWARTGCQQHILYKDFLGRKFTEETDLIKVVKLSFITWFDRKSCTTSQATNNTSSSEKGAQRRDWQNTGPDVVNLIIHFHWFTKQSNYFWILDILRLFSCLLCSWQVNLTCTSKSLQSCGAENRPLYFYFHAHYIIVTTNTHTVSRYFIDTTTQIQYTKQKPTRIHYK